MIVVSIPTYISAIATLPVLSKQNDLVHVKLFSPTLFTLAVIH